MLRLDYLSVASIVLMGNKLIIFAVAVLVALGAGYAISSKDDKPSTSNNSTPTDAPNTESSGAVLDLSGQQLTSLPDSVLSRTDVTTLNVSNNQLTNLPADIAKMTNLEVINVENNRLTGLPPEIAQLKKLREIRANNNRMTGLPPELGNMTGLSLLDISGNSISQSDLEQIKAKLTRTQIKT